MTPFGPRAHAVLLLDDESVVLVRRVENGSVRYEAPGVALEPGETPGQAAARAAREVLGLDAEVGELVYADTELGWEHYFFLARAAGSAAPAGATVIRRSAILGYRVEPPALARRLGAARSGAAQEIQP